MVEQMNAQPKDIKGMEQARLIARSEKRVMETLDALDHQTGREPQDDAAPVKSGRNLFGLFKREI